MDDNPVVEDDVELDLDGLDMRMADGETGDTLATASMDPETMSSGQDQEEVANISPPPPVRTRRSSVAPPLLRVKALLQDESRPSESEVASEARLTRRMSIRRGRHSNGGRLSEAAGGLSPVASTDSAFPGSQSSLVDYNWSNGGAATMTGGTSGDSLQQDDDDDLLDNVGFVSDDDVNSSASDDSDAPVPAAMTASGNTDASHTGSVGLSQSPDKASSSSRHPSHGSLTGPLSAVGTSPVKATSQTIPVEGADEDMGDEQPEQSTSALQQSFSAQTPPPRFASIPPGAAAGHARSSSYTSPAGLPFDAPAGVTDSSPGSTTGQAGSLSTPPTTGRPRTGSVWLDFRNSPNAASVTGSTSSHILDKRHQQRLTHGPYHRGSSSNSSAVRSLKSGVKRDRPSLTISPGSSVASPSLLAAASANTLPTMKPTRGDDFISAGVHNLTTAPAPPKRKFGSEERFEPYATSVHKRRAVSPLTGMSLPMSSYPSGNVSSESGSGSGNGTPSSAGGLTSMNHPGSSSPSSFNFNNQRVMAAMPSPGANLGFGGASTNHGPPTGYFGLMTAKRSAIKPARSHPHSIARSPVGTTQPLTPTHGLAGQSQIPPFGLEGSGLGPSVIGHSRASSPSPHTTSGSSRSSSAAPLGVGSIIPTSASGPLPIGLGLASLPLGPTLLGSSPKSSGSGPGYGSAALGLSIAANSRDDDYYYPSVDSLAGTGSSDPSASTASSSGLLESTGGIPISSRRRMGSPIAMRKRAGTERDVRAARGTGASRSLTPVTPVDGMTPLSPGASGPGKRRAEEGGEVEGGVERLML